MYRIQKLRYECTSGLISRYLSSAEVSTALRPFYFSVHPDLFEKYPEQRKINENSLQQLSALIEAQQSSRKIVVPPLPFYLRKRDSPDGEFKLINIKLDSNNVRDTVVRVLSACDMPTQYVDKIPKTSKRKQSSGFNKYDFYKASQEYGNDFGTKREVEKEKASTNIVEWVMANCKLAKTKYESTAATRNQVKTLISELCETYGIKQVKYDSGWNMSHIRGALQSLVALATQHPNVMGNLEGRTIALGQFTGVSLDGDVFLNIIDVRNEWLSLIKKVSQEDSSLVMIPNYEKALSSILRNIHICRRKFMPKVSAGQYCSHLRQLITSIGDYYGRGAKFPGNIPESLQGYQIVVEPEAGPLMVSPTGQFITPSSCPAEELIAYLSKNLDQATILMTEYSINKHVEKAIHKEVKDRFGLLDFQKDDSITPAMMITCCERLLTASQELKEGLDGTNLYVTHYYSVLSEGTLCIPWNFKCFSNLEVSQTASQEYLFKVFSGEEIGDEESKVSEGKSRLEANVSSDTVKCMSSQPPPNERGNRDRREKKKRNKELSYRSLIKKGFDKCLFYYNQSQKYKDMNRLIYIKRTSLKERFNRKPLLNYSNSMGLSGPSEEMVVSSKLREEFKKQPEPLRTSKDEISEEIKVPSEHIRDIEKTFSGGTQRLQLEPVINTSSEVASPEVIGLSQRVKDWKSQLNEEFKRWLKEPGKIPSTSDFNRHLFYYKQTKKYKEILGGYMTTLCKGPVKMANPVASVSVRYASGASPSQEKEISRVHGKETETKSSEKEKTGEKWAEKIPTASEIDNRVFYYKQSNKYKEIENQLGRMKRKVTRERTPANIVEFVNSNVLSAWNKHANSARIRMQVKNMINELRGAFGIEQVMYDTRWDTSRIIRGALQRLLVLGWQNREVMSQLEGRIVSLGQYTGVTLDGHLNLNVVDSRHDWLKLLERLDLEDALLESMPQYEIALSSYLRDIHISRSAAGEADVACAPAKPEQIISPNAYCCNLRKLITSLGDFYGSGAKLPEDFPESLAGHQIVVKPEPSRLGLLPSGQFVVPCNSTGGELTKYLFCNLDKANILMHEYAINKNVENAIHNVVLERFGLRDLQKDDNIPSTSMISCCQKLLAGNDQLHKQLHGTSICVTHYYAVLPEGTICIPWDFKM